MDITILGGGNGCYAAAADLSEKGHDVTLWRRSAEAFEPVLETKAIELEDFQGRRPVIIKDATIDLKEAVVGAECILIPLPATAQDDLGQQLAPHLETGQVVYLPPGTFGTYLLSREMKDCGNRSQVSFAETGTLPYLARKHGENQVTISIRATRLPTGVYRARTIRFPGKWVRLLSHKANIKGGLVPFCVAASATRPICSFKQENLTNCKSY